LHFSAVLNSNWLKIYTAAHVPRSLWLNFTQMY